MNRLRGDSHEVSNFCMLHYHNHNMFITFIATPCLT